jgi:hypothetical protein
MRSRARFRSDDKDKGIISAVLFFFFFIRKEKEKEKREAKLVE